MSNLFKLRVNLQPNSKSSIIETFDSNTNEIDIRVSEPPIDGKANKKLIDFLSDELSIRKRNISLDKGTKSKSKIINIDLQDENITNEEMINRINSSIEKNRK